jgi:superfamily II DNA/RNA helicase
LSSFAALGVPESQCAALARRGINAPFPIQSATLPDALAGRDVAGRAPTGSGKTLAFGLVVAARAAAAGRPQPRRPRALVLVPTRELAAQVQRELQALVPADAGPVATVYGGVGYGPQRRALARGVSAVVACPGRLEDLVSTGDIVLDAAELVVLDEADRMADMGFMPAVRRLVDRTPDSRQTLLFSATLDGDVKELVTRYQRDPVHHSVAGAEEDAGDVSHLFWRTPRANRVQVTADLVQRCGSTIVFCRTRHGADRVAKQLGRAGVAAVPIHGRLSQGQRDKALAAFTRGRAPALVATDVAARGIHVDGVACVVHFDPPSEAKDYVHRSGRTGRAGATGVVVSLVAVEDGDKATRAMQRQLDRPEPIERADLARLPVPAAVAAPAPAARERPVEHVPESAAAAAPSDDVDRSAGGRRQDGERSAERRHRPGDERRDRAAARPGRSERRSANQRRGRHEGQPAAADRADRVRSDGRGGAGDAGTVTVFHADRGYGFIARRGGSDVFVHVSNLDPGRGQPTLRAGQKVRFELASGRRGPQAVNVRPG